MTPELTPAPAIGSTAEVDATVRTRAALPLVAAVVLTLVYLLSLLTHFAPAIMSPDANGYVVQARLIATEGRTWFSPSSPIQYVGMHWLETSDGVFHSRYPAGLPLLFAAAWKLGGLKAALLINPLLASATVLLVFFLARPLTGGWFALLAAAMIATMPIAAQHALDADAHIAATFFLVAGLLALRRFGATLSVGWGFLAGLLLGVIPAIRYPEAIAGAAVALWLAWRVRPFVRVWPAVLGAALPIAALLVYNTVAYGAFWRTGYALTNEQTGFGAGYFLAHAIPYLQSLGSQGPAFFAFGVAGLAALAIDRSARSEGLLFAGIAVPLVLLYMAYYFGGAGGAGGGAAAGNLRFLIPTFPLFAVAAAWLLARISQRLGGAGRVAVASVAVLQLIVGGVSSRQALERTGTSLQAATKARLVAEKQIPPGSVLIADRQFAESLDAAGRWRLADEMILAGGGPGRFGGGPIGRMPIFGGFTDDEERPSPQQAGKNHRQQERYAALTPAERRTRVWTDLRTWADGRPVYWLARSLEQVENGLPAGADYESIAEVDAPMMGGLGGSPPGEGMRGPARGGRGIMPGRGFAPGARGGGFPGGPGFGPRDGPGFPGEPAGPAAKLRLVRITFPQKSTGSAGKP